MTGNPKGSKWDKYTTPRTARRRKGVEVTLSDEARATLDGLAARRGVTRSAVVEGLLSIADSLTSVLVLLDAWFDRTYPRR